MHALKYDKFDFNWRSLSSDDKAHNLKDAYFKVQIKGNPKPSWKYIKVIGREHLYFSEDKKAKFEDVEIDFSFPETGFYNFKGTAIYFSRLFTRQWKRGISLGNTEFSNFLYEFKKALPIGLISRHDFFLEAGNLTSLFEGKQIPFEVAYKQIQEEKALARTLSRHVLMSFGVNSENPLLWFRGCPVAEVTDKKKVIVRAKIFNQEIQDLLKKENLEFSF